jgi:hypothetical protein
MKTKKPILRLVALAALSFFTGNEVVAQTNIGAACGCPSYANRTVANITSLSPTNWAVIPNAYGKELQNSQNITLTCDKIWQIDEKLYIGSGSTITIQPGTIIKGTVIGSGQTVAHARALIIERGGKIIAPGTEDCPIIFTANADLLNGTSVGVTEKGLWGGVLICGKASNNLMLATNGPFIPGQSGKIAVGDGLGVLEGFAASIPQDQFGVLQTTVANTKDTTAKSGSFDIVLNAYDNNTAETAGGVTGLLSNKAGQKRICLASTSAVSAVLMIGQTIWNGQTQIGTITEVSTSSPFSSTNPRISVASNLLVDITAGTPLKFTGTYPTILTSGTVYNFNTTNTTNLSVLQAGTTGPFGDNLSTAGKSVNFAAPNNSGSVTGPFQDDDNSGVMTYVSIRHAGANLLVGSEINGLTLASVGRGTKIEHIEIVSCADDNIEIFGGTVNLKYCTTLFGNDDMYDYDLGWTGKAQFLFGMKADVASAVGPDNDNGFEADGGDNSSIVTLQSNPTIYNATIVGNTKTAGSADNRGLSAMNFKEGARGTINNSVFANFKNGLNLENAAVGSGNNAHNAYHNWTTLAGSQSANPLSLKAKCNTFIGVTNPLTLGASTLAADGTTLINTMQPQFAADSNYVLTAAEGITAGFDGSFAINGTSNVIATRNDVVPFNVYQVKLSAACPQAPMDGFFEPANYRGAFMPGVGNDNWLSDWTYSQVLKATKGLNPCVGDLNNDGNVNVTDFNLFAPAFGTSCN